MKKKILWIVMLAITFGSCSNKIIFTNSIKQKLHNKDLNIKEVQFYNSDKIILTRNIPYDEAKVLDGEIKFENGQYVEEIIIKKETPGICRSDKDMELGISFEQGQNKVIYFKLNKITNCYIIDLEKKASNTYKVIYDSLIYKLSPGSENTKLLIRKNDRYIYEINQRVAEGVLVR